MTDYNGPGGQPPAYGQGQTQPPYGQQPAPGPQPQYPAPAPGGQPTQGAQPQYPAPAPYGQPNYGAQPQYPAPAPYGQPPQYGAQPPQATQPPQYGAQPPQATQPPQAAQPPGGQQAYRPQPGYGQQPYGQQPTAGPLPYGQQPYGQQPYGPVPFPVYQQPQRRSGLVWLIIGVTAAAIVITVAVIVALQPGSNSPKSGSPSGSNSSSQGGTKTPPAGLVSGSSGLTTSACPGSGSSPWKLVQPSTVCGIPLSTDAALNQIPQTELQDAKLVFSVPGGFGNYTTGVAFQAMYPTDNSPGPYLDIQVYGFNGTFTNLTAAVKAVESLEGETFYSVPAGPHGGVMQCAVDNEEQLQECVFATPTTLGDIQFSFQAQNIPSGISADASAISVRNAIEVQP